NCHMPPLKLHPDVVLEAVGNDLRHQSAGLAEHRSPRGPGDHAGYGADDAGRPPAGRCAHRTSRGCDNLPDVIWLRADSERHAGVRPRINTAPHTLFTLPWRGRVGETSS